MVWTLYHMGVSYRLEAARKRQFMHTTREREKLIARVRRIRGQIEAVERAIVEQKGCSDVLQTVTAARGALNSLVAEMIEDHVRFHVLDPEGKVSLKRARCRKRVVAICRAYLKWPHHTRTSRFNRPRWAAPPPLNPS